MEIGKHRIHMLLILAVFCFGFLFVSCAASKDDESSTAPTCPATADLALGEFCFIASGTKVTGINTSDSTVPSTSHDPFSSYNYSSSDDQYNYWVGRDYTSGSTSYPTSLNYFDGFSIVHGVIFTGTPQVGSYTLSSSPGIDKFIYSPASSSDVYVAGSSISGSSAGLTLTSAAPSVGDELVGTLATSKMCKADSTLSNAVDNCATSITITSGSFRITRLADD